MTRLSQPLWIHSLVEDDFNPIRQVLNPIRMPGASGRRLNSPSDACGSAEALDVKRLAEQVIRIPKVVGSRNTPN